MTSLTINTIVAEQPSTNNNAQKHRSKVAVTLLALLLLAAAVVFLKAQTNPKHEGDDKKVTRPELIAGFDASAHSTVLLDTTLLNEDGDEDGGQPECETDCVEYCAGTTKDVIVCQNPVTCGFEETPLTEDASRLCRRGLIFFTACRQRACDGLCPTNCARYCTEDGDGKVVCLNTSDCSTYFSKNNNCDSDSNPLGYCNNNGSCSPICIAASGIVNILTENGNQEVRVDELNVGDKVLSADSSGNLIYDEIFYEYHAFAKADLDMAPLLRIAYDGGFLEITERHLLYLSSDNLLPPNDKCLTGYSDQVCVYPAEMAAIGDMVWVADIDHEFQLTPKPIVQITKVFDKVRSPKLLKGNIIVNNVLASCFSEHHNMDEALYSILRAVYYLCPSILESESFVTMWKILKLTEIPEALALEHDWVAEYGPFLVYSCEIGVVIACMGFVTAFLLRLKNSS